MGAKYNRNYSIEKATMSKQGTVIYYNPKCSKCRMTLELLNKKGMEPEVVEYLDNIPTKSDLKDIMQKLGISAFELLRTKEPVYQKTGLSEYSTEEEVINAMVEFPILIERPIVIHNGKAKIGRPPENILEIL